MTKRALGRIRSSDPVISSPSRYDYCIGIYVTCRGFGLLTQNIITFNSRVYYDFPSLGEHLLRCGIDTSNIYIYIYIYIFTSPYNHTKRFTCGEHLLRCGIDTSIYIVFIIINTLQHNKLSRTTAHPRNRASAQPRNTRRASGAPRITFSDFGKPPTRLSQSFLLYG